MLKLDLDWITQESCLMNLLEKPESKDKGELQPSGYSLETFTQFPAFFCNAFPNNIKKNSKFRCHIKRNKHNM